MTLVFYKKVAQVYRLKFTKVYIYLQIHYLKHEHSPYFRKAYAVILSSTCKRKFSVYSE